MEIENRLSQVSVNLQGRQHAYVAQQGFSLSEWTREKLDKEIFEKKLLQFAKKTPLPETFFEDNEIVKPCPPFTLVLETKFKEGN